MIPKSSSKATNPTTDDTMGHLKKIVYASNAVALCTRIRS
jgi:hypothetical protein